MSTEIYQGRGSHENGRIPAEGTRQSPEEIVIPGIVLATHTWGELLERTHDTGLEHGVVVSRRKGRILTSNIFEGYNEEVDPDDNTKLVPRIVTPVFPHGIRSMLPGIEEMVAIHTHPERADTKHLSTTIFSAQDIDTYVRSKYDIAVMLDKGGVHVLTGKSRHTNPDAIDSHKIVADAFAKAKLNSRSMTEVRKEVAGALAAHGINYYFTPDNRSSQELVLLTKIIKDSSSDSK